MGYIVLAPGLMRDRRIKNLLYEGIILIQNDRSADQVLRIAEEEGRSNW